MVHTLRFFIIIGVFTIVFQSALRSAENCQDYDTCFSTAAVAFENSDWDAAIEFLKKAEGHADGDNIDYCRKNLAAAYSNRGNERDERGNHDRAIEDYTRAIELNPEEAALYINRGYAHTEKGENIRAIEDLNKAVKLDPNDAAAYYNRGIAYHHKGDYERATEDFNRVLMLDPDGQNGILAYNNRGIVYHDRGEYKRAIEDFDVVINMNPQDATVYYNRGTAYAKLLNYDMAIEDFNRVIELDPDGQSGIYAYNNRGNAFRSKGDYELAIEDYNKVIETNPKDFMALLMRGDAFNSLGKYESAFDDYQTALGLAPENQIALSAMALLNVKRRDANEVAHYIEKALNVFSGESFDSELGRKTMRPVLEIFGASLKNSGGFPDIDALFLNALSAYDTGDYEKAAVGLYAYLTMVPEDAGATHTLADTCLHLGWNDCGAEYLYRYIRLKPEAEDREDVMRTIRNLFE